MIKEKYVLRSKITELSVGNNQITAIKKSDTTKTGLRLYSDGCIGVAGAIGVFDENKLHDRAKQMLGFKIPYGCEPAGAVGKTVDLSGIFQLPEVEFVRRSEELLVMLSEKYPQFAFSHKITCEEREERLFNDNGADLTYRDKHTQAALLIKHKESNNMMDSIGVSVTRTFDLDDAFKTISETCDCYDEKTPLPDEKMPVVFLVDQQTIMSKFFFDLNGRAMGTGASIFTGKLGEKLFADDFSLQVKLDPLNEYKCFFDFEGTVLPDDRFDLIKNGVYLSPFSSKKIAKDYGYAPTGSASGDYDSVPKTSFETISIVSSGKTIKELLGGRKAIYAVIAGGGAYTPQGEFASPVQASFLFDGESLQGRLPQISIRSNVYDLFGKDFIGLATDGNSPNSPLKYLAVDMHVSQIGDWI